MVRSVRVVGNVKTCWQRELRRRQKVESRATCRETLKRQQDSATTHTARPCCFQGYAYCPRALQRPLPPSRPPSRLCACHHQPSTPPPPASPCAMPRTRLREPPTLQRTVQERDWVLRRVEVCDNSTINNSIELYTCTRPFFLFLYNQHTQTQTCKHQKKKQQDRD
jgi:hypothetical protein